MRTLGRISIWPFGKRRRQRRRQTRSSVPRTFGDTQRNFLVSELDRYADILGVSYQKCFIRNQRTRWGSCSSKGNINLSYKLLYVPRCVREYILIHELCHISEFHHGDAFWQRVATFCPLYRDRILTLREMEKITRRRDELLQQYTKQHACLSCCERDSHNVKV